MENSKNTFALDLFSKMKDSENLFFSPYSIETALGMCALGARGPTRNEMVETLDLPYEVEGQILESKELYNEINGDDESRSYTLHTANALWPAESYKLKESYVASIKENYGGSVECCDYKGNSSGAADKINAWVNEKTHEKIRTIVSTNDLGPDIALVLTNAIYFKGNWAAKFNEKDTKTKPFYITTHTSEDRELMNRTGSYQYFENDTVQVLDMPYEGNDLSMLVVLPKKNSSLAQLEESFTVDDYTSLIDGLRHKEIVHVTIPKFKKETSCKLSTVLRDMGIKLAFTNSANFSDVHEVGENPMKISEVIHKAFVDVNEQGTEAAAATAVVARSFSTSYGGMSQPVVFCADHPFMFFIRHKMTNKILFAGHYTG